MWEHIECEVSEIDPIIMLKEYKPENQRVLPNGSESYYYKHITYSDKYSPDAHIIVNVENVREGARIRMYWCCGGEDKFWQLIRGMNDLNFIHYEQVEDHFGERAFICAELKKEKGPKPPSGDPPSQATHAGEADSSGYKVKSGSARATVRFYTTSSSSTTTSESTKS